MAPRTPHTPRPRPTRRRYDLLLVALVTAMVVALYLETFLRINGLLPELPLVPFNLGEVLFGAATGIGLLGTVLLALRAPAASTDAVAATDTDAVAPAPVLVPAPRRSGSGRRPARGDQAAARRVLTDAA